jgi:hypothetical protein
MGKSLKLLLSAGMLALGAGAALAAATGPSEARTRIFLGLGFAPIFVAPPPAYYYYPPPPPPAYYYAPPAYYAPPPPCRARYDWRWDGYQWRQAYIGCW